MTPIVIEVTDGDNSIAINTALSDPLVGGVILPPGDTRVDHAIVLPSGKVLQGAGRGVSRLIRTDNLASVDYLDKAGVRTEIGAVGVVVRDLTVVSPKVADKLNGFWMFGAQNFTVERCEAINCGYSFWAQEFAQYGVFRDVVSLNGNVHFETTQAYDILFENMISGDGDGDNPLGCEAVWHTLLASRRIVFRNGRHNGKGQPFLVVANDINGDPLGGLIDDIRFENCRAVMTDQNIAFFVTKGAGSVGRIEAIDCGVQCPDGAIPIQLQTGQTYMRGGQWTATGADNVMVGSDASLDWDQPNLAVNAAATTNGSFFSAGGVIRVNGGILNSTSVRIGLGGAKLKVSDTTLIRPGFDRIFPPVLGLLCRYSYPTDYTVASDAPVGNTDYYSTSGLPRLFLVPEPGALYRLRFRGKLKKPDSSQYMRVYISNDAGIDWTKAYGFTRLQKADGSWETNSTGYGPRGAQINDATSGTIRQFEMDVTFFGANQTNVYIGADAVTMMAGAEVVLERLK